jgi:L-ascorbate metabolism protein UlaG (beta-lactamase superfamily)
MNLVNDVAYTKYLNTSELKNGVFYLGHASILISISGKKILIDPILMSAPYGDAWTFFPNQISDQRFFDVDCVIVSHIHQDHYDIEFLKKIDGRIPIIIIGGRPSFEKDLSDNKIMGIKFISPETSVEIMDNVYLYGVNHEINGIDSSSIIYNEEFCVYHGNDNFLTEHSLIKFRNIVKYIDVACIPYAYINWYPFLLEYSLNEMHIKESESKRLVNMYMEFCVNATRILNPKVVIPFGANLILDDGNAFSEMNLAVKTPLEFKEYIDKFHPEFKNIIIPMHAGDFCNKVDSEVLIEFEEKYTNDLYRIEADRYLKSLENSRESFKWQPVNLIDFITKLNNKLGFSDINLDQIIRIELKYLGENILIEIDCINRNANFVDHFSTDFNYHHYILDEIASGYWLNGKRFEEIIGMRKFKIRRVPNIYVKEIIKLTMTVI